MSADQGACGVKGFRYLEDVATLELNQQTCIGCGACVMVCPHNVFEMRSGKSMISDLNGCMECGACSLNCPVNAIAVETGVGCASGMINKWLAGFNIRFRKESGCC